SVKEIGYYAFSGCTSLTSVEVAPENQQFYVENGLVISRKESSVILVPGGLTSAVIPEGVKEIDGAAFRDCTNLTSVTIP
ncbi:leucine-rich repeat protein, partial [Pseudoflavonifractor phocaeensis]|uniref:leucine-rich repeat protein n=1 Tax=Pseudoflavonifractor phocaeensis TaxID=1870988 RepID=UPI001959B579